MNKLEQRFSKFVGARYSIQRQDVRSSITESLFNGRFQSHKLTSGRQMVFSCLSSPEVVGGFVSRGIIPVFVDICLPTYQVLYDEVEEVIDPDLCSGICLPHIYGNPFNVLDFRDLSDEYGIWYLSEGHVGCSYEGKVGSVEDVSMFLNNQTASMTSSAVYDLSKSTDNDAIEMSDSIIDIAYSNIELKIQRLSSAFSEFTAVVSKYEDLFVIPGSKDGSTPSWECFPITLTKRCDFSLRDLCNKLQSGGVSFSLPVSSWRLYGDKVLQQERMYGHDNIMSNTVLLSLYNDLEKLDSVLMDVKSK